MWEKIKRFNRKYDVSIKKKEEIEKEIKKIFYQKT